MSAQTVYAQRRLLWPCLGTEGTACEPIDVDRLPAVIGVRTGGVLGDEPCENCLFVEQQR